MTDTAIDGDISDFFDNSANLTKEFRTDRLRGYLLAVGHPEGDADRALAVWREVRFQKNDSSWTSFRLTPAGLAAVKELQARLD